MSNFEMRLVEIHVLRDASTSDNLQVPPPVLWSQSLDKVRP